jgi:translocation and assembly module TamB
MRTASRMRRALRVVGKGLLALLLVLVALIALAFASLNLPLARRLVQTQVNALLASEFRGSLVIERIGRMGPFGASGLRVRVRDPDGRQVLFADGASARIDTVGLVRSLVHGRTIELRFPVAHVEHVDLSLDTDSSGELLLLRAIQPRTPSPAQPPSAPSSSESSGGVRLTIAEASLGHAWVHGRPPGTPALDAELRDADASVFMASLPSGAPEPRSDGLEIHVRRSRLEGRSLPEGANPRGEVSGRIRLPTHGDAVFQGKFDGDVGGLLTLAEARLEGTTLSASLSARTSATLPRTLAPDVPLTAPLRIRAGASGPLSKLPVWAHVTLGQGTVDVEGEVSLARVLLMTATLRAKHLDLADAVSGGPHSDLSAVADASLSVVTGRPQGTFRVTTEPGRVAGQAVPGIAASGRLDGNRLDGRVLVRAEGARAFVHARLSRPYERETLLGVELRADAPDLGRLPGLPSSMRGQGQVFADGVLSLDSMRVDGHVVATASELAVGDAHLGSGFLDAKVKGVLLAPRVDGVVAAERIAVGTTRFPSAVAHIEGSLEDALVSAAARGDGTSPNISATARLQIAHAVKLQGVSVTSERNGSTVMAGAAMVRVAHHEVRIERAVVLGLGESVHVDGSLTADQVHLRLDSPYVEIRRLARALGRPSVRFHGSIGARADLVARRSGATGQLTLDLADAAFDDGSRGQGHLNVTVERDHVAATAHGVWSGSRVDLEAPDLRLAGPPTEMASWLRASGQALVDTEVDLRGLRKIVPAGTLPFEQMRGRLTVAFGVSRSMPGAMPDATLSLRTSGLRIARKGVLMERADGTLIRSPPVWVLSGVDFDLDAATSAGRDQATLHGVARDQRGAIVDVFAGSSFPPLRALTEPGQMRAFLRASPVDVRVSVPRRDIANLPGAIGRPLMEGSVELTANLSGNLENPRAQIDAYLRDFKAQRHAEGPSTGGRATLRYDGHEMTLDAAAESGGRPALSAKALGHVELADVLARRTNAKWDGSLRAKLDGLPLEAFPQIAAEHVRGGLSGDLDVAMGTGVPPRLHATLGAKPLSVGRQRDNAASVRVDVDERMLAASATVEQPGGSLEARANLGVSWPTALSPNRSVRPPAADTAHLSLLARNFRLAVLRPFVRDVVQRLDGKLDSDVRVDLADGVKKPTMRGQLTVKDGVFELPNVGEEFRQVRVHAAFQPNGVIVADDLYAKASSGSLHGNASVRLNGLSLETARADIEIPKREALPVSLEGQVLGEASGKFQGEVTRTATGELQVAVNVPKGGIRLPDQSPRALQALEPAERVRVGVYRGPDQFEVLANGPILPAATNAPTDAPGARVAIHVKDLEVRRGTTLRVRLSGDPVVKTGKDAGVFGKIVLGQGFIEVQGKRFEMERGTITFTGEADNPEVVVTAGWTAPEGTRVHADFVGPLKTGKVTLRSEPPYTKSEILSLILFGTTTGSTAAAAPGTTAASTGAQSAAGIGGGLATQGLNRALDDLTGLDVTARVDTTDAANPRPELEVRIARDITVAIAHVLGVPPPGTNPDRNLATVDWRFLRNWSLQTTFGDAGSSLLDLVWQYRY